MTFAKGSKISSFTMELCQIIQKIYSLTDKETIKSIAASHILSTIDRFMGEDVRILLISGNMRLETLLGFVDSKYNNALQSFSHYVSANNFLSKFDQSEYTKVRREQRHERDERNDQTVTQITIRPTCKPSSTKLPKGLQ